MRNKCVICKKPAVKCYSPDIDITGICVCKKHTKEGIGLYMALINGGQREFNHLLKAIQNL